MEQKEVIVYSTPSCHFCHAAKDFFNEKGVTYTDYDVASNMEKRQEMVEITGQMGVPVIRIGEDVVVGFDQKTIAGLLNIA